MSDELFEAYKIKASELLQAKAPFGEHQRRAFEIIVGVEIERLKGEITELTKHVELRPEHKKDPIWALLKTEMASQGYRKGYDQAMEKSHQLLDQSAAPSSSSSLESASGSNITMKPRRHPLGCKRQVRRSGFPQIRKIKTL
jgi:hypothetical protein